MIHPEIKSISCDDLAYGEQPSDSEDCSVSFVAMIGLKGQKGADVFYFDVVTPKYLMRTTETRWGRGCLIVDTFSWSVVEMAVQKLISHCTKQTWQEVAAELSKELHWEFENYQPYNPEPSAAK